jgi:hypothetical protein
MPPARTRPVPPAPGRSCKSVAVEGGLADRCRPATFTGHPGEPRLGVITSTGKLYGSGAGCDSGQVLQGPSN